MFIARINSVALVNPKTTIKIFHSYFQTDASEINRVSWSGNLQLANLQIVQNLLLVLHKLIKSCPQHFSKYCCCFRQSIEVQFERPPFYLL
jgi:hypothetical protein